MSRKSGRQIPVSTHVSTACAANRPKAVSAQNKVELDKLHPVAVDALGLIFTPGYKLPIPQHNSIPPLATRVRLKLYGKLQLASSHLHVRDEPGHVAPGTAQKVVKQIDPNPQTKGTR